MDILKIILAVLLVTSVGNVQPENQEAEIMPTGLCLYWDCN